MCRPYTPRFKGSGSLRAMSSSIQPSTQLWGVYRSSAPGAPGTQGRLLTFIAAPNKQAARRAAVRLGFTRPTVKPITSDEAIEARWLPIAKTFRNEPAEQSQTQGQRV